MNSEDIKKYEVTPDAVWDQSYELDSDDLMDEAAGKKWRAIGIWGRDGYDLGEWPLVVIYFRSQPSKKLYSLTYYVEGDIVQYNASTREERDAICDYLAHWHWRSSEKSWVQNYPTVESLPPELRGPYRNEV